MIVRLTRKQSDHLEAIGTGRHADWIRNQTRGVTNRMVDIAMPPIGWKTLADTIPEYAFGPLGGRRGDTHCLGAALRRVSQVLARAEAHPALKDLAVPGRYFEWFLAWGPSPYPDARYEPAVMVPETSAQGGIVMTLWRRDYDLRPISALLQVCEHWAFLQPPVGQLDFTPPPEAPSDVPSP